MFGLFKKAEKAPAPQDSLVKLKDTLSLLEKRIAFLTDKINKEIAFCRANIKDKNACLLALKRKKPLETERARLQQAELTLQEQIMAIESAGLNRTILDSMSYGAQTLQRINKNTDVDKVDDTMLKIQEQMEVTQEISNAISRPLGSTVIDEDDLLAELQELEDLATDELVLPAVPASSVASTIPSSLPAVPSARIPTQEELELAELESSMAF